MCKVIASGHGGKVLDSARGLYKYTSFSSDSRIFEIEVSPRLSLHNFTTVRRTYMVTPIDLLPRHSSHVRVILAGCGSTCRRTGVVSRVVVSYSPTWRYTVWQDNIILFNVWQCHNKAIIVRMSLWQKRKKIWPYSLKYVGMFLGPLSERKALALKEILCKDDTIGPTVDFNIRAY